MTEVAAVGVDTWAVPPHRLRDLRGRERAYALVLLALVLVPFVVALVRAYHDGWIPSGDEANIALRAFDVFTRHPPLTGLPSTSALYGDKIATNHPGPLEFFLLAGPLRVLGSTTGPLLTAAAINAGFALVALWAVFRRLGTTAVLWAGVVMLLVIWSAGTSVLTDTLSSNMTMYSLLCSAVLAWALIDGDLRLLPLAAFVGSYAAQQHLAAGIIVAALGLTAVVAIVVHLRARKRAGDAEIAGLARRNTAYALIIMAVCWAPVVLNEIIGRPGNITEIVRFSFDNTRSTMGFNSAIDQALHAVTLPTILGKTDLPGTFFLKGVGPYRGVLGVVVIALLAWLAWSSRRHDRTLGRLALVAMVVLLAGFVNGVNIPLSTESWRVNLYRWEWTAAFLVVVAIGIVAERLARGFVSRAPAGARALAPVALLLVTALIAVAVVAGNGNDDHNRERSAFALEKRVGQVVLDHVDRNGPVLVAVDGYAAQLSVGPYVIYRLARAGLRVEVQDFNTQPYGHSRRYQAGSNPSAILISSGEVAAPSETGELLATEYVSPERSALLNALSAASSGQHARLAAGTEAALDDRYQHGVGTIVAHEIAEFPSNARTILEQPLIDSLILDGTIHGVTLDAVKLRRLMQLSGEKHTIGDDEVVQVHLLTNAQLRAAHITGV
jgi:hypothetical protein